MAPAFKVLAVDGGGIRGIIPALVLAEIEARTTRPISDLFDLFAGTSTGGIIALGLVTAIRRRVDIERTLWMNPGAVLMEADPP